MSRPSKTVLIGLVTAVVALAALLYVRIRFAIPTDKLEPVSGANRQPDWPPGEPAPIRFAAPNMSSAERREFLNADYRIARKVADLPAGIRKLYTAIHVSSSSLRNESFPHKNTPAWEADDARLKKVS